MVAGYKMVGVEARSACRWARFETTEESRREGWAPYGPAFCVPVWGKVTEEEGGEDDDATAGTV
jgi:hypothetical protein